MSVIGNKQKGFDESSNMCPVRRPHCQQKTRFLKVPPFNEKISKGAARFRFYSALCMCATCFPQAQLGPSC